MRKILLSMALLSTVTSEEFGTKKHRPSLSEGRPQFWLARGNRIPWDLSHFDFEHSSKDKDGRRRQESSLNRISGFQPHDFNRFLFDNLNLFKSQENRQASENYQNSNQQSNIDKKKTTFLMPFDRSELSKINLNQDKFDCIWERCRRRTQGWILQEPLYVDEPTWVQINSENFESPLGKNEPFFVTRGKRSLKLKIVSPLRNTVDFGSDYTLDVEGKEKKKLTNLEQMNIENNLKDINITTHPKRTNQGLEKLKSRILKRSIAIENYEEKENLHETEGRVKREDSAQSSPKGLKVKIIRKRSETESQKLLESIEKSLIGRDHSRRITKASTYLQPRNKHSDILEILEEPFFISRGKKNNFIPLRDFSMEDFYLNQYLEELLSELEEDETFSELELAAKKQILNKILNNEVLSKKVQVKNKYESGSNAKRGALEELNLQLDPFYVARG